MNLKLFNTLSRSKEIFKPIHKHWVGIYTCGPTVYQNAHIGNIRTYIVADVLKRTLRMQGYSVKHVINITDVGHLTLDGDSGEDKVELEARKKKKTAIEISHFYTRAFLKDLKNINVDIKNVKFPFASKHIKEQISLVKILEKKGFTYKTEDGIYFDSSKFENYANMARLNIEGMRGGARVRLLKGKKHITDFALWKFSNKSTKREQEWKSPWGIGFPGWHIECSAMSMKYLGKTIDIHTSGIDHIPVHHTNEIAQSETATGKKFVHYWVHSEFVTMDGEKMAKSLGNTLTLSAIEKYGITPSAYRYWLLSAHYRKSVAFKINAAIGSQNALNHIIAILENSTKKGNIEIKYINKFKYHINNDLDTPKVLAIMWELLKDKQISVENKRETVFAIDKILGIGLVSILDKKIKVPSKINSQLRKIMNARNKARKNKDWVNADKLRKEIENLGYNTKDNKIMSIALKK